MDRRHATFGPRSPTTSGPCHGDAGLPPRSPPLVDHPGQRRARRRSQAPTSRGSPGVTLQDALGFGHLGIGERAELLLPSRHGLAQSNKSKAIASRFGQPCGDTLAGRRGRAPDGFAELQLEGHTHLFHAHRYDATREGPTRVGSFPNATQNRVDGAGRSRTAAALAPVGDAAVGEGVVGQGGLGLGGADEADG